MEHAIRYRIPQGMSPAPVSRSTLNLELRRQNRRRTVALTVVGAVLTVAIVFIVILPLIQGPIG